MPLFLWMRWNHNPTKSTGDMVPAIALILTATHPMIGDLMKSVKTCHNQGCDAFPTPECKNYEVYNCVRHFSGRYFMQMRPVCGFIELLTVNESTWIRCCGMRLPNAPGAHENKKNIKNVALWVA